MHKGEDQIEVGRAIPAEDREQLKGLLPRIVRFAFRRANFGVAWSSTKRNVKETIVNKMLCKIISNYSLLLRELLQK